MCPPIYLIFFSVEGLINDDTEESDGESSSDESITCNKRRNDSESEDIMEDDLELIKENTGVKIKKVRYIFYIFYQSFAL